MKKSIYKSSAAYFLVVLVGYAVDFSIYSTLIFFGWDVVVSNVAAFCVGASVNAFLVRRCVFDGHRFPVGVDFALTLAVNVGVFFAGTWLLAWLVNDSGMNPYIGKIVINAFTFAFNFIVRALVFRKY